MHNLIKNNVQIIELRIMNIIDTFMCLNRIEVWNGMFIHATAIPTHHNGQYIELKLIKPIGIYVASWYYCVEFPLESNAKRMSYIILNIWFDDITISNRILTIWGNFTDLSRFYLFCLSLKYVDELTANLVLYQCPYTSTTATHLETWVLSLNFYNTTAAPAVKPKLIIASQ